MSSYSNSIGKKLIAITEFKLEYMKLFISKHTLNQQLSTKFLTTEKYPK